MTGLSQELGNPIGAKKERREFDCENQSAPILDEFGSLGMGGSLWGIGSGSISDESRECIYGFLAASLSHPDQGNWGRVLNPQAQRCFAAAVDLMRSTATALDYPLGDGELPPEQLNVRLLVLELCQPLEHLKAEYERVLCDRRGAAYCSPFELDYREDGHEADVVEDLASFATSYRAFDFFELERLPRRPDHIGCELDFMYRLLQNRRLASRLAPIDPHAARLARRCDLAQEHFFGDHLAPWVTSFAIGLEDCPGGGYLEAVGRFLAAWMPLERHRFGMTDGGELEPIREDRELAVWS